MTNIFSADFKTKKELKTSAGAPIADVAKRISADVDGVLIKKGNEFAKYAAVAKECGFRYLVYFKERKPQYYKIDL